MTTPLVDTHVHLFDRTLPLSPGAWTHPDHDLTTETFLPMMTAHGVGHAVISAMSLLADQNTYTLTALRSDPRLRATIDLEPPPDLTGRSKPRLGDAIHGTDPIECSNPRLDPDLTALRAAGVVGLRFQWRRRTDLPDLTGPGYRSLLRQVAELGWHVELNIESARLPPVLDALLASRVNVVVDHFGDPHPETGYANPGGTALLRALATGRVWTKLSAGYRFRVSSASLAGYAETLLDAAGPEHLFWGSDAPFIGARQPVTYRDAVDSFTTTVPDPQIRDRITRASFAFYFDQ
ncbi:amidohydrolase family protein, partial [Acrocarpospora phusangensis]|uniref:amidohydrolase family protein n=1 Tax=Acrocarpospora phusangensis TaxID=1070424 RepID=UPI0019512E59